MVLSLNFSLDLGLPFSVTVTVLLLIIDLSLFFPCCFYLICFLVLNPHSSKKITIIENRKLFYSN